MRTPKRQKKSDRLIWGHTSAVEVKIDMMLAPITRATEQADIKWGIDRLPEIVSAETAAKWGMCCGKLRDAVRDNDEEAVAQWVGASLRGLKAMDAEAAAAGAQRASMDVWEVEVDGELYGVMRDARSWQAIEAQRPELTLVSLREVALALTHWRGSVAGEFDRAVKQSFGEGAEVVGVRKQSLEDEIPF